MHPQPATVKVVRRAFDILEALVEGDGDTSLTHLSERTGLALSTAHRLLATMVQSGYLRQDPATGRYLVGARLTSLAERTLTQDRVKLRYVAHPFLRQVVDVTGETANLATLTGGEAVWLDQIASDRIVRAAANPDEVIPLHCSALGKTLLAFQDSVRREKLIERLNMRPLTANTLSRPEDLRAELERVRTQGYAVDNEEIEIGMRCIAAPVFLNDSVIAAISITGPVGRVTESALPDLCEVLRSTAQRVSDALVELN